MAQQPAQPVRRRRKPNIQQRIRPPPGPGNSSLPCQRTASQGYQPQKTEDSHRA